MSTQMDYEMVKAQPLPAKPAPAKMTMGDRGVDVDVETTDEEDNWWKKPAPGK